MPERLIAEFDARSRGESLLHAAPDSPAPVSKVESSAPVEALAPAAKPSTPAFAYREAAIDTGSGYAGSSVATRVQRPASAAMSLIRLCGSLPGMASMTVPLSAVWAGEAWNGELNGPALMRALTDVGFTAVLGTNCEQSYDRYLKVGEQVRVTTALDSVVGPKTTGMGVGYFVTSRNTWYVGQSDEVVATMLFRVLKFVPKGSVERGQS